MLPLHLGNDNTQTSDDPSHCHPDLHQIRVFLMLVKAIEATIIQSGDHHVNGDCSVYPLIHLSLLLYGCILNLHRLVRQHLDEFEFVVKLLAFILISLPCFLELLMLQVILDQWIDARERLDISVANCRESDFASSGWGGVGLTQYEPDSAFDRVLVHAEPIPAFTDHPSAYFYGFVKGLLQVVQIVTPGFCFRYNGNDLRHVRGHCVTCS
jgi:hypothetical protein